MRCARLNPAGESGYTRHELKAKRFFDFAKPDDVGATPKPTITAVLRGDMAVSLQPRFLWCQEGGRRGAPSGGAPRRVESDRLHDSCRLEPL